MCWNTNILDINDCVQYTKINFTYFALLMWLLEKFKIRPPADITSWLGNADLEPLDLGPWWQEGREKQ